MTNPDESPRSAVAVEALENAIHDIDESDSESREFLLSSLLCAAWPSRLAQCQ